MTQYCLPFFSSSSPKPTTQAQAQAPAQASFPTSHQQGHQSQRLPFWKRWHATSQHRRSPRITTTTSAPPTFPALAPPRGYTVPPIPLMFLFENSLSSDIYDSDDDEDISEALLEEVGGNFPRARRRHQATLTWREHHGVDTILDPYLEEEVEEDEAEDYDFDDEQYLEEDEDFLKAYPITKKGSSSGGSSSGAAATNTTPSPNAFQQVLSVWPRWIQGRTLDGDVIWYEDVGKLRGSRLRQARIKPAAWAKHLALVCEYITHCFEAEVDKNGRHSGWYNSAYTFDSPGDSPPSPRVTLVLNFAGITSASFFADWTVRKALRTWGHILAAHYPGLVRRVLLVNVSPALSPKALAVLRPLLLLPAVWRDKMVLVVDQEQEGAGEGEASMPLCDAHRAFLAPIALTLQQQQQQVEQDVTKAPPPTKQSKKASKKAMDEHLLSDVTALIAPSVLSAAVFPGRGLNEATAEEAHEWQTLMRFVKGKAEEQERCEKERERDGKGNGTSVVVEAVEMKDTEAETKDGDQ